ncbi:MAG: long-chain fatty acid--CoA ligase [Candidatus Wallbacteria bacterium]|nr:long-chain fatty acid--CoA ligase [Candidatus Wallbacteria bacterium]
MRFNDWITHHAAVHPEKPALVLLDEDRTITYSELSRRVDRAAHWLGEMGVGPGERVAVLAPNSLAHWELYFATAKLTALFVPFNFRLAAEELKTILHLARPKVLVVAPELAGAASNGAPAATRLFGLGVPPSGIDSYEAALMNASDAPVEALPAGLDTVHQVLYTSGTTGQPKGAMLTLGQVHWNSLNTGLATDLTSQDSTITYTPLFHTGGLHVLSTPLFHRGATVFQMAAFDAERILAAHERYKITTLFGVPTTFQMLAESPSFQRTDLSSVRFCLCGGAPCPIPLIELYALRGLVFRQGFGMTEVGPNCFSLPPQDAVRKAGTVGRPMLHVAARVVDASGAAVPPGAIGELELSGPVVSAGYLENPVATTASRRDGWFRTGDLASVDSEGYFRIAGRSKEMWISGGENVYPAEIENALATHPGVSEACCFGVPDAKWGEIGWAAVVIRAGYSVTSEALLEFLRQRLARYKVPRRIDLVSEMPRNASGKVLKHYVRALMEERSAGGTP